MHLKLNRNRTFSYSNNSNIIGGQLSEVILTDLTVLLRYEDEKSA